VRRALVLMGLTAINTAAVFAYQWFVVTQLGAGDRTDALFAGMVVPQLVLNVISGSLAFVLVPMLSVTDEKVRSSAVWSFAAALAAIFGILAVILWLLTPWWVPLTVPGFDATATEQTVALTRIQLLGMFFAGLAAPFNAAYQARQRFAYPALMAVIAALLALVFVVGLLGAGGIEMAAWGLTLRYFLMFVLQVPAGFPFSRPNFRSPGFQDSISKLKPLITGTIYYKTDQLLDRFLASMAPAGQLSILHLAQQIYAAASLVLVNALAAPAVPRLSKYAAARQAVEFKREIARSMASLVGCGAIMFLLVAFGGQQILAMAFEHGAFGPAEVDLLWTIMLALGLVWFAGLTGQVLSTSFYAAMDTSTPTRIGVIGFTLGIPLKVIGFYLFGVIGIAVATGLFAAGNAVAMYWMLRRKIRDRSVFDAIR